MAPTEHPPQIVRVAGWIWVVLGTMLTAMSLLVLVMAFAMKAVLPRDVPASAASSMPGGEALSWLFEHFEVAVTLQTLFYTSVLMAAVFLLRARSWARTYLEVVCWLAAGYIVVFMAWFAYAWSSMSNSIPSPPDAQAVLNVFSTIGVVMAIAISLFWLCPVGALIWLLRRPALRTALT